MLYKSPLNKPKYFVSLGAINTKSSMASITIALVNNSDCKKVASRFVIVTTVAMKKVINKQIRVTFSRKLA
jgi:hypothetical protein